MANPQKKYVMNLLFIGIERTDVLKFERKFLKYEFFRQLKNSLQQNVLIALLKYLFIKYFYLL